MYTLQELNLGPFFATDRGIFACAKFTGWSHEYNFLIQPDGKVKGKTSSGFWYELSSEASEFIMAKVRANLISQNNPAS